MRDPNLREWNKIKTIYTYHLNQCTLLLVSKVCNKIHTTYIYLVTALKKNFTVYQVLLIASPQIYCIVFVSWRLRVSAYWSHLKIK